MKRVQLIIEYDGTRYGGWQRQENSLTVQEVLEEALKSVVGSSTTVHSSGRTDAGVHALGMSVHFDTTRNLPLSAYREGVNRLLPEDVVVRDARFVDGNFHARFSAQAKWYRYSIHNSLIRSPLRRHRSWYVRAELDIDKMMETAVLLSGEHDFSAFTVSGCDAATTTRRIDAIRVVQKRDLLTIDVAGNGFLRYMVRRISGTLVEVGAGKRDVESVLSMIREPGCHLAGVTAPAHGLCLMRVYYPGEDLDFWENFP